MGRCEGGAAVGREAGDSVFRAHRVGPKGSADAAPAGGGYAPCALGRPWPTVRRHYDRLPAVLRNDGLHAAATKERWPPLRIGGLNTGPVATRKYGPKGLQERRINSPDCASLSGCGAPGGASSRSQGMRRRLTASRAASPAAQGASQAPAFPGAPLPLGSGGLEFARGPPRGRPKSTGDESCVWPGTAAHKNGRAAARPLAQLANPAAGLKSTRPRLPSPRIASCPARAASHCR